MRATFRIPLDYSLTAMDRRRSVIGLFLLSLVVCIYLLLYWLVSHNQLNFCINCSNMLGYRAMFRVCRNRRNTSISKTRPSIIHPNLPGENSSIPETARQRTAILGTEGKIEASSTLRCPNLTDPVLPHPLTMPRPCQSNDQYYSSPLFCHTNKTLRLITIILTKVDHFSRRQELRKEWVRSTFRMTSDFISAHSWAYVFVVGRPKGNDKEATKIMNYIDIENCHYKDVLFVDVLEDYYNLTWKKMAALDYLIESDINFEVLLKTDDDAFVNIQLILEWLTSVLSQAYPTAEHPFYAGRCLLSVGPIRDPQNKWYVSPEDYPFDTYPPYCSGAGYFLSRGLIEAMLQLCDLKKSFRMEDVHSGLLVSETGLVPPSHIVQSKRIFGYATEMCNSNSKHPYPFIVPANSSQHYNEFMNSLCK